MKVIKNGPEGIKILKPNYFFDRRGYFYEIFNEKKISEVLKKKIKLKQCNISFSKKNVFRGLHFQIKPHLQEKIIRVIDGEILDIVLCLDKKSKNYLKTFYFNLSSKNQKVLYLPSSFAHGFLVLSKTACVEYFVTNFYSPKHERNISIFDKKIKIRTKLLKKKLIISDKDQISNYD